MNNNATRTGFITASEIVNLTKSGRRDMTPQEQEQYLKENPKGKRKTIDILFGDKAMSYLEEVNFERLLNRSIEKESNAKPLNYGSLVESYAFKQLGMEYQMTSDVSVVHPTIPYFSGSADGFKYDEGKTCVDFKCAWTLLSYCRFAECKTIEEVVAKHPEGEKYKWQVTANAIINDCKFGEIIFFCPYKKQLAEIRELAQDYPDKNKVAFVHFATDEELPWLPDNGYFKNLHTVRWEIPAEEKSYLENLVIEAGKLLVPFYEGK